jgi:hypothetical protein
MKMDWFEVAEQAEPDLRKGDIDICIKRVEDELIKLPDTPFHQVMNYRFTNNPGDVAEYFDQFIIKENARFEIKAIYTETNGFYINPDLWFFDLFAYDKYGGHDDYDWLSDWKSGNYESMTLTGLEKMQEIYEEYMEGEYDGKEDYYSLANDLCSLIIVLYFQDLIKKSAPLIKGLETPLLATAHDFDFIYEYTK